MKTMLEQLRYGFRLDDTATPRECLDHLARLLADDVPGCGQPTLTQKLARLLDLGSGATPAMILGVIKERLAKEAEKAIRLVPPTTSQKEEHAMSDARHIASRRIDSLMRDSSLSFSDALARVRRTDPQLSDALADWYGWPAHASPTTKWDVMLSEQSASDPREQLKLRALEIVAKNEAMTFGQALQVARTQDRQLGEAIDLHYAGPAR